MTEEWRRIHEFPTYSISDHGRVRNDITDRIMVLSPNQTGIIYVGLMHNGFQYKRSVPRLVAEAFVEATNRHHDTPIHLNGDRTDNRPDNIMYRPRHYAVNYMRQFEERYQHSVPDPIRDKGNGDIYENSWHVVTANGLLESEVVNSIINATYVWPTYQIFELAE